MEKTLTAVNIVQAQRGTVQFTELDNDKKQVKDGIILVIQFIDPKEAAAFSIGEKYTVAINKAKK